MEGSASAGAGGDEEVVRSDELEGTTGRYLVVLSDEVHGDEAALDDALRSLTGVSSVASTSDFNESALDVGQARTADATLFAELGIAVVSADPDQAVSLNEAVADPRILAVEPERVMYAISGRSPLPVDYLRGYHDAVAQLYERTSGGDQDDAEVAAQLLDTPAFTWGLQATNASTSPRSGLGVAVAVLDTGFDLGHPDFAGRKVTAESFVSGEAPQDGHGHGTHCVGTACGPAKPPGGGRRYGVAFGADVFVGKVLSNAGSGTDTGILAGMNWAIANGCRVISMSLGADVRAVSMAYETVGRRALDAGVLIVAAAGNNAGRPGNPGFVGRPANCPSIMAVGAVDSKLGIAGFSARSNALAGEGGQVDIAAPGVAVESSWLMPQRRRTINGTSMATPHVAGIAALWSEATGATGAALWAAVTQAAQRLMLASVDVGAGLSQAPQ